MRCYSCSQLSFDIICKRCRTNLFPTQIGTRKVGSLDVIYFYKYSHLETLLHTKHKPEGYRIYKALAKMTFKPFMKEFLKRMIE